MDSREEDEELERKERAKQEFEEEQDEEQEEELNEKAAPDEDGASSKFQHSMDDDDEEEGADEKDTHRKKRNKDKDKEDEEKNNDEEDGENENEGTDDVNNRKPDLEDLEDNNQPILNNDGYDRSSTPEDLDEDAESSHKTYDDEDDEPGDDYKEPPKKAEEDLTDMAEDADELGEDTLEGAEAAESAEDIGAIAQGSGAGEAAQATAAGGGTTAAAGTTAGGSAGAAAAGAGGGAVAVPLLIVLLVILIIFILIGVAGFLLTMPQFIWNSFKKMALSIWNGLEGYVVGMDEALVEKEDVIGVTQYLYDMGYDLVGMGFAEEVEIYGGKDENGNEIPVADGHQKGEIKSVEAPYLRSYLVAENRTYLVNNFTFNVSDFVGSFYDGTLLEEGSTSWGAGMLDFDLNLIEAVGLAPFYGINLGPVNVGELVKGIKVERETNTLRIRRLNPELAFCNT